jgi:hypothetical protein
MIPWSNCLKIPGVETCSDLKDAQPEKVLTDDRLDWDRL